MFDESSLTAALAEIGYRRVKRHVYRADWSTDVEHFLYCQVWGARTFLALDWGIRNLAADLFTLRSERAYGSSLAHLTRYDQRLDCCMRFPMRRLDDPTGLAPPIVLTEMPGPVVAAKVKGDIERKLFPIVRNVTNLGRLVSLLLGTDGAYQWMLVSTAWRAAVIVKAAQQAGAHPEEIRAQLLPHLDEIGLALQSARDPDPAHYVDRLIRDAFMPTDS